MVVRRGRRGLVGGAGEDRRHARADVEMMLARIGGFGLGSAPDAGPDLSAYEGLLGRDAA